MNEVLIRQYATGSSEDGIRNLITIFDQLSKRTERAELLCKAAWDHALKLERKLEAQATKTETFVTKVVKAKLPSPKESLAIDLDI